MTSGTSVPIAPGGEGQSHAMRPIGLGLIRSDIRYRPDAPVRLVVRDGDRALMEAHLVERNLPSPAKP